MLPNQDTICAIATAPGVGGIAVIRLSGKESFAIASRYLCTPKGTQCTIENCPPRRAIYGIWHDGVELIDEVVVLPFVAPHSFTGEDVVEISCHGSRYITRRILETLIATGARIAQPGEFSQRAYLNERMDLSEAEAIADIIAAESAAQHKVAMQQMRGGYSAELNRLREHLLHLTALMELELDFPEEDVEFANRKELINLTSEITLKIKRLIDTYRLGNAVRNGIPVAIVGATNVGKSTLLNAIVGEERAIVSDIHGTTRDTVEDTVNIGGYLFRFMDTAGLRNSTDTIEALGIERSRHKILASEIVLGVIDASRFEEQDEVVREIIETAQGKHLILIINKRDLVQQTILKNIESVLINKGVTSQEIISISAKEATSVDLLRTRLTELMEGERNGQSDIIVSNARHHQLLQQAYSSLTLFSEQLTIGQSTDLLTLELRHALSAIGEITGTEITTDETLHFIFAHFCIGK